MITSHFNNFSSYCLLCYLHRRDDARGLIVGLTGFNTKAHIVRAALEAAAFQVNEQQVVEGGEKDSQERTDEDEDGGRREWGGGERERLEGRGGKGKKVLRCCMNASVSSEKK